MTEKPANETFDTYAAEYDAALQQGLSVSGEGKDYFARGRVEWLRRGLAATGFQASAILDFGCGTGSATPFLREILRPTRITGTDVSAKSIALAREWHGGPGAEFMALEHFRPAGQFDLAYCNGVFHHIPPAERTAAAKGIFDSLRPGGLFALWENNPWNPGTRLVMSRISFDRDAITLTPPESRRLLRSAGFEVLRCDFRFYFPRVLGWFRPLELALIKFPLGAQYQVLARRPAGPTA